MIISALAFYFFAMVLVLSALMVITARNPVHSVLFLILGFFTSSGLFLLLGAEFVAMIMVIVYVGAVAVLFLFVVMMLDVDFVSLRKGAMRYVPLGIVIGGILMLELVVVYGALSSQGDLSQNIANAVIDIDAKTNTHALGQILYTKYVGPFQIAGLILFVAMIGAIVLTHRKRPGIRKQNVSDQQAARPEDILEIRKVTPRTGA